MFRRFVLLLAGLMLLIAPLQAGTIHEVFNQTYTLTGATLISHSRFRFRIQTTSSIR
jgi:hypothetical protein